MNCKAFIFDMDGVIIDSEPLHFEVDRLTMKHFGVEISKEELEEYVGMTNPEMWAKLKVKHGLTETVEEIIDFQLNRKIAALAESVVEPIDGVAELLEELRRKRIKIGLASSSPRRFIEAVLGKFGIREYFQCIVSGEEVAKGKPAPDVFLAAAKLLGADPGACNVLEDSRNGVAAAKAAGMKCIGFQNLNSGNQDLSRADRIVSSLREIGADRYL